jgi:hypothetical protein
LFYVFVGAAFSLPVWSKPLEIQVRTRMAECIAGMSVRRRLVPLFIPTARGFPCHWAGNKIFLGEIAAESIKVVKRLELLKTFCSYGEAKAVTEIDARFNHRS